MIRLNESPSFLEPCIQSKIVYPLSLSLRELPPHRDVPGDQPSCSNKFISQPIVVDSETPL